jgi:TRAP-type C4-dicarboxylate transport system permease small subunit
MRSDWPSYFGLPLWAWLFVVPTLLAVLIFVLRKPAKPVLSPLWAVLDAIYFTSGVVGAFFLVAILGLIVANMTARWTGNVFAGATEYAGYCMAAASFFALAHALNRGAHIRVSLFLGLSKAVHFWLDALATLVAAIIATYFARYAIKTIWFSKLLNDRTQGLDELPNWLIAYLSFFVAPGRYGKEIANIDAGWSFTPVWLPQLAMGFGAILLAVALWDNLYRMLVVGESRIKGEGVE